MRKLTYEYVYNKLKERNFTLLSDYKNTRTKIHVKCDICDYEWDVSPNTLLNNVAGCPQCSNTAKITTEQFIEKLNYFNLKLKDGSELPKDFNSKMSIEVTCLQCGCDFLTSYNKMNSQKSGCPACKNKKVLIGFNDLWTTHPEFASLLRNKEDGYKCTYASNKRFEWKCPICGNLITKMVNDVVSKGLNCQLCREGISYPEKFLKNILICNNIDFEYQKVFDWLDNKRYDFYLKDTNTIIEVNGMQHYEEVKHFATRSLSEEIENDCFKKDCAISNGIENYIILDCRYSNCDWIKKSILDSKFLKIYKNLDINWDYIDLLSRNHIIYQISDLYNLGKQKDEIKDILKISDSTYYRYINIASKNNLCNYHPKIDMIKRAKAIKSKKILCITTNKTFDCIKDAADYYDISYYCLKKALRENKLYYGTDNKTNKKLKWKILD